MVIIKHPNAIVLRFILNEEHTNSKCYTFENFVYSEIFLFSVTSGFCIPYFEKNRCDLTPKCCALLWSTVDARWGVTKLQIVCMEACSTISDIRVTLPESQSLSRFHNMQEITPGLLTVPVSLSCHWTVWKGSVAWKWLFLCPVPCNDFEVLCTLQRRNLVSAIPALISPKSFRCSALLEIKLITINDIEGWELSLHGTPYSSIFHIKFK